MMRGMKRDVREVWGGSAETMEAAGSGDVATGGAIGGSGESAEGRSRDACISLDLKDWERRNLAKGGSDVSGADGVSCEAPTVGLLALCPIKTDQRLRLCGRSVAVGRLAGTWPSEVRGLEGSSSPVAIGWDEVMSIGC